MSEVDKFYSARKHLRKATDVDLENLHQKIFKSVPELSWVNKAVESALLLEIFWRTGRIDEGLFPRVMHTVEDTQVFDELKPVDPQPLINLESAPIAPDATILFLSSKFGNFVSSQEYVGATLNRLNPHIDVKLASRKPIDSSYSKRFDSHNIASPGDLRHICKTLRIEKIVDLSGDYAELLRGLNGEIHIADLWGLSVLRTESTLAWNEMIKYHGQLRRGFNPADTPIMFLPPISALRNFPEIVPQSEGAGQQIRLGAFCRTAKLNLRVIDVWAQFMVRHASSTLDFAFIQSNQKSETFVKKVFAERGVSPDRISFLPRMDTKTYLGKMNSIDINLGGMPEQGGISCMDSLSMGCPYPVCDGLSNTYVASTVLRHLGLDQWVASTVTEYQALLDAMVSDMRVTGAKDFRDSIRNRLLNSPLSAPDGVADVWSKFLRVV